MERLLSCATDWEDVGEIVDKLCATKLGYGMFAWAQQHVVAAKLGKLMEVEVRKLASMSVITDVEAKAVQTTIVTTAEGLVGIGGLPSRSHGKPH